MQLSGIWLLFTYLYNYTEIGNILPVSPFLAFIDNWSGWDVLQTYMGYINWFIPFGWIIDIMSVWAIAIGVFYGVQAILRWIKVVGD